MVFAIHYIKGEKKMEKAIKKAYYFINKTGYLFKVFASSEKKARQILKERKLISGFRGISKPKDETEWCLIIINNL